VAKTGDILAAMRRNPAGDWTIEDIRRVCGRLGIECLAPSRGSHWKVAAPGKPDILVIPARRPIKPIYIRKFVAISDDQEREANG
jgi:hypothetical protein